MKQRIKRQLIHNEFVEWIVLAIILLTALSVRFAPEIGACFDSVIVPELEVIEVYEETIRRPNDYEATEHGIATGSVRTALTITQEGGEAVATEYGILRFAALHGSSSQIGDLGSYTQNDSICYDSMILTADERAAVELAVMSEAGCESREGQMLVAECIYNAAVHDGIGVFEVLEQYQYALRDDVIASESVKEAVAAVFDRGERITDEPVMFFYNPDITSCRWHETLCYVLTEGRHRFFRLW